MEFIKYQHIEKIGMSEVEGILNGKVHLSYKIDGSNGCVFLNDEKTLSFGSRKRILSLEDDNQGFVQYFLDNKEIYDSLLKILIDNPSFVIYGEWLVPVTIKRYQADAWHKFYIFDILDTGNKKYLNYETYSKLLDEYHLLYIKEIAVLDNPSIDDIKSYLDKTGEFLISSGLGEGIVIKNYDYLNKYGRRTWAKLLCEDFLNRKKDLKEKNHILKSGDFVIEKEIISKYLTIEHVNKEKSKIIETYGEFSSKNILELLNRVFDEFMSDNLEIIIKKMKLPTINFKMLKKLSDDFVKEVINFN